MSDIDPRYPYIALIVVDQATRAKEFLNQQFSVIGLTDCRIETQRTKRGGYIDRSVKKGPANGFFDNRIRTGWDLLNIIVEMSDAEQFAFLDAVLSLKLDLDTTRHPTTGSSALGFLNCVIEDADDVFLLGEVLPGQIHVGDIISLDEEPVNHKLIESMKDKMAYKL